ncbi:MAG: ABC transporter substrate-binding protein [Cellvibrio sp.]|nr:ABC transporter substrate-binding protein [Cellvibrio sp.]
MSYFRPSKFMFFMIGLLIWQFPLANSATSFSVHYRVESIADDGMYTYYIELIKGALDNTQEEYGPYQLIPLFELTFPRAKLLAKNNLVSNLLIGTSYSTEMASQYAFVPLPIDFGMMSYRVCFTRKEKLAELKQATQLDQLRQYTIGQGKSWLDVEVLKANGFNVIEYASYKSLFPSVARGRFDLFCRSVTEILPEWDAHKSINNLALDESFALYYPFPRFFWTNKNNHLLLERVTKGLTRMYQDGTALKIWKKHNQKNLDFAKLSSRRIFYLHNPQLEGIDLNFKQYFYNPPF